MDIFNDALTFDELVNEAQYYFQSEEPTGSIYNEDTIHFIIRHFPDEVANCLIEHGYDEDFDKHYDCLEEVINRHFVPAKYKVVMVEPERWEGVELAKKEEG